MYGFIFLVLAFATGIFILLLVLIIMKSNENLKLKNQLNNMQNNQNPTTPNYTVDATSNAQESPTPEQSQVESTKQPPISSKAPEPFDSYAQPLQSDTVTYQETPINQPVATQPLPQNNNAQQPAPQANYYSSPEYLEKQRNERNLALLITGSIFILLSAIIFISSSWGSMSAIIKIIWLSLGGIFFWVIGRVAAKFKLEKAALAFEYISMGYIPILFIAIGSLSLLGDYLSFKGEGRYIYLAVSSLIVAIVYFIQYKRNIGKAFLYLSNIFQCMVVSSIALAISETFVSFGIGLVVYNVFYLVIANAFSKEHLQKFTVMAYVIVGISSAIGLVYALFIGFKIEYLMLFLLNLVNYLLLNKLFPTHLVNIYFAYAWLNLIVFNSIIYGINIKSESEETIKYVSYMLYIILQYAVFLLTKLKDEKTSNALSEISFCFFAGANLFSVVLSLSTTLPIDHNTYFVIALAETIIILAASKISTKNVGLRIASEVISEVMLFASIYALQIDGKFFIAAIIGTILLAINYPNTKNERQYQDIVPLLGILLYAKETAMQTTLLMSMVLTIFVIYTLFIVFRDKKVSLYVFANALYLLSIAGFTEFEYAVNIALIVWSLTMTILFRKNLATSDWFHGVCCLAIFELIIKLFIDYNVTFKSLYCITAIIATIYLSRVIIKRHSKTNEYEIFESIIVGIIYLYALTNLNGQLDTIIFMSASVGFVFISFFAGFGILFFETIISLICDSFLLIDEFWLNLLIIGIVLIMIAVVSEINNKDKSMTLVQRINNLKDQINSKSN